MASVTSAEKSENQASEKKSSSRVKKMNAFVTTFFFSRARIRFLGGAQLVAHPVSKLPQFVIVHGSIAVQLRDGDRTQHLASELLAIKLGELEEKPLQSIAQCRR